VTAAPVLGSFLATAKASESSKLGEYLLLVLVLTIYVLPELNLQERKFKLYIIDAVIP
jgi:hypothetical protein